MRSASRLTRLAPWAALAAVAMLLAAACADGDPPPRSPFEDDTTVAPGDATPRPLPTFPSTPPATATGTPSDGTPTPPDEEALRERIVGGAIARLAEWTGVPETDIALDSIEARDWPSACLGVAIPDRTCAEVVTPGYQVRLQVLGALQFVNASRDGNYAWQPAFDSSGRTIESVDVANGIVALEPLSGSDEQGREHRVVAGSYLSVPLGDLVPGDEVALATTHEVPSLAGSLIVWLVVLE